MLDPGSAAIRISRASDRLRGLTQHGVQTQWQACPLADLRCPTAGDWAIAPLNERGHVAWPRGRQVLWLRQQIRVPLALDGYPLAGLTLRLALTWWAEQAQIFVDGHRVQEGDLFDCSTRLVLQGAAQPGTVVEVALRLVSPGHDDGALVAATCLYENPQGVLDPVPEPGFVADELAILQQYYQRLDPDQLEAIARVTDRIPWGACSHRSAFDLALADLRDRLRPFGEPIRQRRISALGHAHLDLAWLWPIAETWEVAERTFRSVLDLQAAFPELVFGHSTPALYAWLEEHRPDLFAQIQRQMCQGRWEAIAGLWVEPELMIVQGESIVRQVLYGQRYSRDRLGVDSRVAWLPDSFGFCAQLPQIFSQGGIRYFATLKLDWNDTTQFPYRLFDWRSPDGSSVVSILLPPIGVGIDPLKMAQVANHWEAQTEQRECLWLPGVGDHGGGPSRDMLEVARRWAQSPFFPELTFSPVQPVLDRLAAQADPLPVWQDELYLELHRGCYTTHADQKWYNRRCEEALYQAELWSSLATLVTGCDYPAAALETAWKQVLVNQFHDILPGSSIPEVFDDANRMWQAALATGQHLRDQALGAIAGQIQRHPPHPQAQPILVVNSLPWSREEGVAVPCPAGAWRVVDAQGVPMPSQRLADATHLWIQPWVPSLGYRLVWLVPEEHPQPLGDRPSDHGLPPCLENEYLRVQVDPATGELASLYDRRAQREVLGAPGNQLQAFRDRGQYWDAWNIAPDYADHPLPPSVLLAIDWQDWGPLRQRLRVVRQMGQSRITQDYILDRRSPVLQIDTQVDWQEEQVLLKAAIPVNLTAPVATYDAPFGAVVRSTQPTTPAETAKWEVPALHWADLTQPDLDYGVSLLSDTKHGYDSQPSQLRLTLLKAPLWPDPTADRGHHHFTYGIYPHAGSWQAARTVHYGKQLNQPLQAIALAPLAEHPRLPPQASFLELPDNLMLSALKRCEAGSDGWVVRTYECHGEPTPVIDWARVGQWSAYVDLSSLAWVNLLEELDNGQMPRDRPWAIQTARFQGKMDGTTD
jgi:alpha-mannosidase